jgi:WD40 repeat protein
LETSHKEYKLEEENKLTQQRRARRRTRMFAIVLGSASIISVVFMIQAFLNKQEAETQTEFAKEQTIVAEQQKDEALKQKQIADEQKQKALESEQEALKQKELANDEKKNAEYSARVAQSQRKIADQKSLEALEQRSIAEESAKEAKLQQQIAEEASLRAQKLRMLSISQSMSVKSLQIDIDTTLKGLVAYQAHLFNKEFEGNEFNPDVYNGLYYSYKYFYGNKNTDYQAHNHQVRAMAFHSGSQKFFSTGSDGKIMKLDLDNVSDTSTYFNTNQINRSLTYSPDGKYLILGLNNGDLLLFNLSAKPAIPELLHTFAYPVNGSIYENNNSIIAFDNGGKIIQYNRGTKQITPIENTLEIKDIFMKNGHFYSTSKNGYMYKIKSFTPLVFESFSLSYSDDGKIVTLNKVANSNEEVKAIISSIAVSENNEHLVLGDISGNVLVFNNKTFEFQYRLTGQTARINNLQFDKKTQFLASASNDGSILIWSTENFNLAPYKLTDNESWVMLLNFVNDDKELVAAYFDGKVRKWPIAYDGLAEKIKNKISRNFTTEEWKQIVAPDINYKKTIPELP